MEAVFIAALIVLILICISFGFWKLLRYISKHRVRNKLNPLPSQISKTENYSFVPETIPKRIIQTYISKDKVPKKVFDNISWFASDYEYEFFSDKDCIDFLKSYFTSSVVDTYHKLKNKAHKADLFRYCYLYERGGVYLDIKTELIKPLNTIFKDKCINTVIAGNGVSIYQGIIAAPPKNRLFLELIEYMRLNSKSPRYHLFVNDFYNVVEDDVGKEPNYGANIGKDNRYYLLREKCVTDSSACHDGLDRYGICCNVYDGNDKVFKSRYADFPWK